MLENETTAYIIVQHSRTPSKSSSRRWVMNRVNVTIYIQITSIEQLITINDTKTTKDTDAIIEAHLRKLQTHSAYSYCNRLADVFRSSRTETTANTWSKTKNMLFINPYIMVNMIKCLAKNSNKQHPPVVVLRLLL